MEKKLGASRVAGFQEPGLKVVYITAGLILSVITRYLTPPNGKGGWEIRPKKKKKWVWWACGYYEPHRDSNDVKAPSLAFDSLLHGREHGQGLLLNSNSVADTTDKLPCTLIGCLRVRSVAKLCPVLCDTVDCSPPGFSVHGISQARIPEWVAISSSPRGSSQLRDWTQVSWIGRQILYHWATREASTLSLAPSKKILE